MTVDKRFTSEIVDTGLFRIERITDHKDGVEYSETDTVTDLLNDLNDENMKLKNQDYAILLGKSENENTILKHQINKVLKQRDDARDKLKEDSKIINELSKERRELNSENQSLKENYDRILHIIDTRIDTLKANSSYCHQSNSHDKGIEFTSQAELLERLKEAILDPEVYK